MGILQTASAATVWNKEGGYGRNYNTVPRKLIFTLHLHNSAMPVRNLCLVISIPSRSLPFRQPLPREEWGAKHLLLQIALLLNPSAAQGDLSVISKQCQERGQASGSAKSRVPIPWDLQDPAHEMAGCDAVCISQPVFDWKEFPLSNDSSPR